MASANRYEEYGSLKTEEILEALSRQGFVDSNQGLNQLHFIQSLLLVRTIEPLTVALRGGTEAMGRSANHIGERLDGLAQRVDASSKEIQTVGEQIGTRISDLVTALDHASADLKAAGELSSTTARRLNWLTFVLAFGTIVMAVATVFQVRIGNRQAQLMERQIQLAEQQQHSQRDSSAAPSAPPKK